jgi:hypothetical protein
VSGPGDSDFAAPPLLHRGRLGNFRAGAVGSLTTPTISAVSGGLATIAGTVVIGLALPAFVRYGARPEPVGPPTQSPAPG